MLSIKLAPLGVLLLFMATMVSAQTPEPSITSVNEVIQLRTITVIGKLQEARNTISSSLGATTYRLNSDQINLQSQGASAPFNQVLLRTPGTAQDSFGQIHMRGEHANLQYRINDILLPEGISGFGQELDSHFLKHVDVVTGSLPAQYGLRTAGVVNIQTKGGEYNSGGLFNLAAGSFGTLHPSLEYGATAGKFNSYFSASYLQNDLGIENPTAEAPIHDTTQQSKGFGSVSYVIDDMSSLNLIMSASVAQFQIPNTAGVPAGTDANGNPFQVPGVSSFDSTLLNETQRERNGYAVLSYQKSMDRLNFQLSALTRYSDTSFQPDVNGDLFFNGVASQADRKIYSNGLQADASFAINDTQTLRSGFVTKFDTAISNTQTTVFNTDSSGSATGNPYAITDNNSKTASTYSLYLQDEWKITDAWTLNYGGRFDQVNAYLNESNFSPRVNMTYKLSDATTVHAGYAHYFTPPPMELVNQATISKFDNTTNASEVTTNDSVRSEQQDYFDVGVTHRVSPRTQVGLDAYYKSITNLLDEGQFGQALIFSPFNYARGKIYGTEATITYVNDAFSSYANLAISHATGQEITSAQFEFSQAELDYIKANEVSLDHDQLITASWGVAYKWTKTRVFADMLFGSGLRKGFANTEVLPAYFPVNLGVAHDVNTALFGKLTARLDLVNIFDQVYQLRDGSGIGVGAPQYGARRSIYTSISMRF